MSDLSEVIACVTWGNTSRNLSLEVLDAIFAPDNRAALVAELLERGVIEQPMRPFASAQVSPVEHPYLYRGDRPSFGDEVWFTHWVDPIAWPTLAVVPLYRVLGEQDERTET